MHRDCMSLSDNARELVKNGLEILNTSQSNKNYLYLVWGYSNDDPASFEEALTREKGLFAFGYYTDHGELVLLGREDISFSRTIRDAMEPAYKEILEAAIDRASPASEWMMSFCLYDILGREVLVGTRQERVRSDHGERALICESGEINGRQ